MTLNNMSDDTLDSYMDRVVISKPAVLTPVCPAQLIFRNTDQESQITRRGNKSHSSNTEIKKHSFEMEEEKKSYFYCIFFLTTEK